MFIIKIVQIKIFNYENIKLNNKIISIFRRNQLKKRLKFEKK